jgi:hypothetical protein
MTNQKRITIHVGFTTVIIFSVLWLPLLAIGLIQIFQSGRLESGLGFCAAGLFTIIYFCSPTVCLNDERLTYCKYFLIWRSIELKSISRVNLLSIPSTSNAVSVAVPTLFLHQAQSKPFKFVIKPFSKAGVSLMMRHIRRHAPNAEFDRVSSDLAHGDFASVTRQTIKNS